MAGSYKIGYQYPIEVFGAETKDPEMDKQVDWQMEWTRVLLKSHFQIWIPMIKTSRGYLPLLIGIGAQSHIILVDC
jgi:hypothetical protein